MGRAASHRLLSRHSRLVAGVGIVGCSSPQARDRGCGCGGAVGFEGLFYRVSGFADLLCFRYVPIIAGSTGFKGVSYVIFL